MLAIELFDFVSGWDKGYLESRLKQLKEEGKTDDPDNRYLLPTSDILKRDLIALLDSLLGLTKIFDTDNVLETFEQLGIVKSLNNLDEGIPRSSSFSIFYRLEQFGHLLKEKYDAYGLSEQGLSREEGQKALREKLLAEYGSLDGLKEVLEERVKTVEENYWDSWSAFLDNPESPFPEIAEIIFSVKDPVEILELLKSLLD